MARGPLKPKVKKVKGQLRLKGISGIPVLVTEQDAQIAHDIAEGRKTIKQALMDAGISESNARSNSAAIVNSPGVQAALKIAMRKAGATLDRVAGVIDEGLSAQKIVVVKRDAFLVPDHGERRQFAEFTAKLCNWFPDKKLQLEHSGSIGITDEADKELIDWLRSSKPKQC